MLIRNKLYLHFLPQKDTSIFWANIGVSITPIYRPIFDSGTLLIVCVWDHKLQFELLSLALLLLVDPDPDPGSANSLQCFTKGWKAIFGAVNNA